MESMFLNAALGYLEYGFYVFPLKPKSKTPLTGKGFKDASNDPHQVIKWWTQNPNANLFRDFQRLQRPINSSAP